MMGTCLITGATGALGPTVARAFAERGYRVRAFSRHMPQAGLLPSSADVVVGDIGDPQAVLSAVAGVDVVVHLAALLHVVDPPPSLRVEYERVNVAGTDVLVRACEAADVQRIVYFSTISIYGYTEGRVLTEALEPAPETGYGRTKLAAEKLVLSARNRHGLPIGTVLRLAAVYGARIAGNYRRLVRALSAHQFIPLGRGDNHRALIYDKDVTRAAVLATEHPDAAGEVFNVSDGTTPTLSEVMDHICAALGRRRPRFSIPVPLVRVPLRVAHTFASFVRVSLPITPATLDKYTEDVVVDSAKIRQRLGFTPLYDQKRGWQDAIAGMRAAGVLPAK